MDQVFGLNRGKIWTRFTAYFMLGYYKVYTRIAGQGKAKGIVRFW